MEDNIKKELVQKVREKVMSQFSLKDFSDELLQDKISELIGLETKNIYLTIEEQVQLSDRVFSSIRGFGILDSIMSNDDISEVMINGPENIFIEEKGKLRKIKESFESEKRLDDIIQRIVGQSGREVNQANPIVDTRLPDGSRVNVVLPLYL